MAGGQFPSAVPVDMPQATWFGTEGAGFHDARAPCINRIMNCIIIIMSEKVKIEQPILYNGAQIAVVPLDLAFMNY